MYFPLPLVGLSFIQLACSFVVQGPLVRQQSAYASSTLIMRNEAYESLQSVQVKRALDGESIALTDAWRARKGQLTVVAFFTHFGDFNAWEYAQKLSYYYPDLSERCQVVGVGIGTVEGARVFSEETGFPMEKLLVDTDGEAYKKLGFSQGFQPPIKAPTPYLRLLPMLAGIGSPGTIREVLKGYTGDRNADAEWIGSALRMVDISKFDRVGTKGTRPFELATLRLQNMKEIVTRWGVLSPPNKELITQQGGTLIFDGQELVYEFKDKGILVYTDVLEVLRIVTDGARGRAFLPASP